MSQLSDQIPCGTLCAALQLHIREPHGYLMCYIIFSIIGHKNGNLIGHPTGKLNSLLMNRIMGE